MNTLKQFWRKSKFFVEIFFIILLSCAVLLVGFGATFTSVNLTNQQQLTGTLTAIEKQQTKGSKAIPGRKNLKLMIDNKAEEYLIFRSSQDYADILSTIKPGDEVKIYYGYYRREYNDFTVYQLEKKGKVIYAKNEYEDQEQFAGRFICIPVGVAMLGMAFYKIQKRRRIIKNAA